MVVVVDYGICNVRSVVKALELVGATVRVSSAARDLEEAERIVLPGVGAFEHGMTNLAARGLIEPLADQVLGEGKPFLGICLGMQLLARTSHEFGVHEGLGWLPATVKAFALEPARLKVPHIGWTEVSLDRASPMFAGVSKAPSFYFVHSYHMVCDTTDLVGGFRRVRRAVHRRGPAGQHLRDAVPPGEEPGRRLASPGELPPVADLAQARAVGAKVRLVPILLLKSGRCMKGRNFASLRDTGNPVTAAKVYDAQRADELVFLDIAANEENRQILFDVVQGVAEQCFMPLTVGGGVRTLEDMRRLLQTGADKVAFNTAAVERPALVEEAARTFGSANVVVSIDARRIAGDRYEVWTHSGRQATGLEAVEWARRMAEARRGRDPGHVHRPRGHHDRLRPRAGRRRGRRGHRARHRQRRRRHAAASRRGGDDGHASAVAAASIFHFTDQSPIKARSYMRGAGLHVRAA